MWYVWFGILSEAMISNMKGIMMGLAPGIYSLYQIHIYTVYNIYIYILVPRLQQVSLLYFLL